MRATLRFGKALKYTWGGMLGCWFTSTERGVREGDMRVVGGRQFQAYYILSGVFRDTVHWTPAIEICISRAHEEMRDFKLKVLNG